MSGDQEEQKWCLSKALHHQAASAHSAPPSKTHRLTALRSFIRTSVQSLWSPSSPPPPPPLPPPPWYNTVEVHHPFWLTQEDWTSSVSRGCSPLPRGWGRTWPSSGCPPPSPPPQSSAPPPGAACRCLPASPTDPTEHTVGGTKMANLWAKSRAVPSTVNGLSIEFMLFTERSLIIMKHFLPAGQTSCFNEHYFTSPARTWYGIIVKHRFGSGIANNGS